MVIGLLDSTGTRVFAAGKLDNGTDGAVNGDTVFEIGSVTKTFTSLVALDMDRDGMWKLNDPVAKYLPVGVRVPSYEGMPITDTADQFAPEHFEQNLPRAMQNMATFLNQSLTKQSTRTIVV